MRAVFAVLGFIAFYAITALTVAGLGWLGLKFCSWAPEVGGRGTIMMFLIGLGLFLAAAVLAWSALPRIDRFEPPGPELKASVHPELFAMIREVAKAANQRMPVHVYAVLEVNAFVAERGGIMGVGSKRIMGVGMGLLNAFTIDEVRGVIAHEFGHFHGGDTRLGPWVYKTRSAMARSVVNLRQTRAHVSELQSLALLFAIVEAPFRWMALGYMRLAAAVSRSQELSADAVAARTVGTEPVLTAFRKLAGTAAALDAYLDTEIGTLVEHGVLPPVLAGARQFIEANRDRMKEIDRDRLKFGEVNAFDSHPPLGERIEAIEGLVGKLAPRVRRADDRMAIELVRYPEKLVRELIAARVQRPLESVEWNEVAPHFVRSLHYMLAGHRRWLADRTVADLDRKPETARKIAGMIEGIGEIAYQVELATVRRIQGQAYTAAFAVALEHVGYEPHTGPGEPLLFRQGDATVDPGKIVSQYLSGELSDDAWVATWESAGLHERPWAAIAWKKPPT